MHLDRHARSAHGLSGLALLALSVASLAACGRWVDLRAPWDDGQIHDVGRPVLSFRWQRVIVDHTTTNRPQEMAQPALAPLGAAEAREGRGAVFVGSHAGDFIALSTVDGSELWRRALGSVSGTPLVAGDAIYIGTDDGEVYSLHAATGAVKWKYTAKGAILRPPVAAGDTLLFSTDLDRLIALDRDSGKFRWQYQRELPEQFTVRGNAGPAVDGEQVLGGFADGHVVAVARATGDVLWVRSLAGEANQFVDVDATPIIKDGIVYAASVSGGFYALSASDGTERWRARVPGVTQVVLDDQRLYVAAAESGLWAFDLGGHSLWRQGMSKAGDPATPIIDGQYLFLSVSENGLYIVDKRDGSLLQSFSPGPGITAPATIANDQLYLLSNGGILYAMNVRHF